jgi:hypothetical protein
VTLQQKNLLSTICHFVLTSPLFSISSITKTIQYSLSFLDLRTKLLQMRNYLLLCLSIAVFPTASFSQITLTGLPSGANKKAMVGERIGLTDVTNTL